MKKRYEMPQSVEIDMIVEEGLLGLSSGGINVKDTEKKGSEAWSQKKNPIWE